MDYDTKGLYGVVESVIDRKRLTNDTRPVTRFI